MKTDLPQQNAEEPRFEKDDEVKQQLMNKYRKIFVEKLTEKDLLELQDSLQHQFTETRGIKREYKERFEAKLREYFHEEILQREIVSIEVLVNLLQPGDLKTSHGIEKITKSPFLA